MGDEVSPFLDSYTPDENDAISGRNRPTADPVRGGRSGRNPLKNHLPGVPARDYIARSFATKDFSMRRPKGIKTKKAFAKRFKITAGGKVLRASSGKRHLNLNQSAKRRRNLRGTTTLSERDAHRVMESMPFSHR